MKRREIKNWVLAAVLTVTAMGSGYALGHQNAEQNIPTYSNWASAYCDSNLTITDWNTDGKELSFMLSDGTELYATKSENAYTKRKQYIAFDDIADVERDSKGNVEIVDTKGNIYTIFITGEY